MRTMITYLSLLLQPQKKGVGQDENAWNDKRMKGKFQLRAIKKLVCKVCTGTRLSASRWILRLYLLLKFSSHQGSTRWLRYCNLETFFNKVLVSSLFFSRIKCCRFFILKIPLSGTLWPDMQKKGSIFLKKMSINYFPLLRVCLTFLRI